METACELGHIGGGHFRHISAFLGKFEDFLRRERRNFTFVHGDMSEGNVILCDNRLIPIDFSLSGYALPEMDLADMIADLEDESLTPFLLEGYESAVGRPANRFYIDVYLIFSIIMYIAYHRATFPGSEKAWLNLDRWTNTYIAPMCEKL